MTRQYELGKMLKKARTSKNLSQREVAEQLGITIGCISGYERNYRLPDLITLKRLADLYEIPMDAVLEHINDTQALSLPTILTDIANSLDDAVTEGAINDSERDRILENLKEQAEFALYKAKGKSTKNA